MNIYYIYIIVKFVDKCLLNLASYFYVKLTYWIKSEWKRKICLGIRHTNEYIIRIAYIIILILMYFLLYCKVQCSWNAYMFALSEYLPREWCVVAKDKGRPIKNHWPATKEAFGTIIYRTGMRFPTLALWHLSFSLSTRLFMSKCNRAIWHHITGRITLRWWWFPVHRVVRRVAKISHWLMTIISHRVAECVYTLYKRYSLRCLLLNAPQ